MTNQRTAAGDPSPRPADAGAPKAARVEGPAVAGTGRVLYIHVTPTAGAPMESLHRTEAITGKGLAGDRYANLTGHWSPINRRGDRLTLVEQEEIDRMATEWGLPLAPGETRRNLTTKGIRLDGLIGNRFAIGPVICLAVRHCEPCTYLEQLLCREVIYPLVHRAGIRVEILQGGPIAVGDPIVLLED